MTTPRTGTPQTGKPNRGWIKWILIGCGALLALGLVLAAVVTFVVLGVNKATAAPEKVAREFLAAAAAGDYAAAHEHFSVPLKQEQSYDDFVSSARANAEFFQITHTSFSKRSLDGSGAEFSGTVTLKSGSKLPVTFKLIKENERWKLLGYHIGS